MTENPPPNPAFDLMANHLSEAALEVFAAYDVAIRRCATMPPAMIGVERSAVAVIGYAGEGVRGALVLVAAESAIRAWMAAVGVPEGDIADTIGEFSNMLLGRLKGRLGDQGMTIHAATPTTAMGSELRLSTPPGLSACSTFDGPGWKVSARLDANFDPGFELPVFCRVSRPAQAGDGILFVSGPRSER